MKKNCTKKDAYEQVTNRIIEQLEKGVCPWLKPWHGSRGGAHNRITGRPYSFINQMLLLHDGEYASFKQWSDLGGKVKKGEKAEYLVQWFTKSFTKKETFTDKNGNEVTEDKTYQYIRPTNTPVFHISQIEGIEPLEAEKSEKTATEADLIGEADAIIDNYVCAERIKLDICRSNSAYYQPAFDMVVVPEITQYDRCNEYYSTVFHELAHSTGISSRLNRDMSGKFGSKKYAKEELVAELTACFILDGLGIDTKTTERNSAAYIDSWLHALKNDKTLIINAAAGAEKAANYIKGIESK